MDFDKFGTSIQREGMAASYEASRRYLEATPDLAERVQRLVWMVGGTLFDASPGDIDSLMKIGYEPFSEAQTDFRMSVTLAMQGAYKSGYHHLRSFFELYMVGLYCLLQMTPKSTAHAWLKGSTGTPFFKKMLGALFSEPNFQFAQQRFGFRNDLNATYKRLCNFVHAGGPQYRHRNLSQANYPRFIPGTLRGFVDDVQLVLDDISTAFVLHSPVLLTPLPVGQKFGINGPVSGFLEEGQVNDLRYIIRPNRLLFLDDLVAADPYARSVEEWFHSHPDITEEQLKEQFAEHKTWLSSMKPSEAEQREHPDLFL